MSSLCATEISVSRGYKKIRNQFPTTKNSKGTKKRKPSMSKAMSMSSHRGGHLYMQTNEVRNCVIHIVELRMARLQGWNLSLPAAPVPGLSSRSADRKARRTPSRVPAASYSARCLRLATAETRQSSSRAAAEIGGTSGKVRVLAGDISSPATGAALGESGERHFGGLDKFDSGTRWPSFTTQGGGR